MKRSIKTVLIISITIASFHESYAQQSSRANDDTIQPVFPGGNEKFFVFVHKALRYPAVDRENNVSGKVLVSFVVDTAGNLTDIKSLRGPSQTMEDEAERIVKTSPKWSPGIKNGHKVRVQLTAPINFTLSPDEDNN